MSANLGSLVVSLEANMAKFESDMNRALGVVDGLGKGMAEMSGLAAKAFAVIGVAASVDHFKGLIGSAIEAQAQLSKLAQTTGATVEALSGLKGVAKLSGTDMDTVAGGVQKLSKAMVAAGDDTSKSAEAFNKLGISSKELAANMSDPGQMMLVVAKHMDEFKNGAGKTAAAMEIFGKTGANLLPMMHDLAEQGELNGKITDYQAQSAEVLERQFAAWDNRMKGLYSTIATAVVPALSDFMTALIATQKAADSLSGSTKKLADDGSITSWARTGTEAMGWVINSGQGVVIAFQSIGLALGGQIAMMQAAGEALAGYGKMLYGNLTGGYDQMVSGANQFKTVWSEMKTDLDKLWTDGAANQFTARLAAVNNERLKQQTDFAAQSLIVLRAYAGYSVEIQQAAMTALAKSSGLSFAGQNEGKKELGFKPVAGAGAAKVDPFDGAYAHLGEQVAKLDQMTVSLDAYKNASEHAKAAEIEFLVTTKAWNNTGEEKKQKLIALAAAFDLATNKNNLLSESMKAQEAGIKAGRDAAAILEGGISSVNGYTDALRALDDGKLKDLSLSEQQNYIGDAYRKMIETANVSIAKQVDSQRNSTDAVQAEIAALLQNTESAKYNLEARARLSMATVDGTAQYKNAAIAAAQYADSVNKISAAFKLGIDLESKIKTINADMILDDKQRAEAMLQIEVHKWQREIDLAEDAYAQLAALNDSANADKLAADRIALDRSAEALQKYVETVHEKANFDDFKKVWSGVESAAQSAFYSIFEGGSNTFVKLRDSLKSTLIDMLYQMTVKKWLIQIGAEVSGTGSASGVIGGGSNMMSMVGSAASFFGGGAGAAGGGVTALSGLEAGSGGGMLSGVASLFGSGAGAGAAGGAVEAMSSVAIGTEVAGGVSTGLAAGFAAVPVVGWIALAALALYSMFGEDGPEEHTTLKFTSNNRPGNFSINERGNEGRTTEAYNSYGAGHEQMMETSQFGTYGVNSTLWANQAQVPQYLQSVHNTDNAIAAQLSPEEIARVTAHVTGHEYVAGTGAEGADTSAGLAFAFTDRIRTILEGIEPSLATLVDGFKGNSAELANEAVTLVTQYKHLDTFSKAIGETVTMAGMAALAKEGETAGQAIARVGMEFATTSKFAEELGKDGLSAFGKVGLSTEAARASFIAAAGGLQALTQETQFYSANFRTVAENSVAGFSGLDDSLAEFGLSSNSSHDDFRHVMEGLDLTTEAGRNAAATLLKVAPAFVGVTEALAKANNDIEKSFMSSGEMASKSAHEMESGFAALGLKAPHTRDEMRALYASLDDGSAKSNSLKLAMQSLIPGFDAFIAAMDNIDQAVAKIHDSAASSIFNMQYGLQDNQGKYNMLDQQGTDIDKKMRGETDINKIAEQAQKEIDLLNQAWGLLDNEQQKAKESEFEAKFNAIDAYVNEKGATAAERLTANNKAAADTIAAAVDAAISRAMTSSANAMETAAAALNAEAAKTINVTVTKSPGVEVSIS